MELRNHQAIIAIDVRSYTLKYDTKINYSVFRCEERYPNNSMNKNGASAGNRTRVTSMATRYSTTRPQMLHSFRTFRIDIVNGIDFKLRGIFIY
nr:hypothetical protein MACL_00001150 [Theileria orientalis]